MVVAEEEVSVVCMTPEAKVKEAVKKILKTTNTYFFMPPGTGYGRAGIPDIVACENGHFIAIECKAGKGKTTALQERELADIRAHGGVALVINETNIDDVRKALENAND